ncbi:MAG: hypothetical protein HYV09_07075 [Deltaproteobacteria bacterium]|nr:hypothetical protein [Deltaproteobacteria bacterium]
MSTRPSVSRAIPPHRSPWRFGAALAMVALGGLALAAPGCGGGDTRYRCDSTGCFDCDSYGCKAVPTPTLVPCAWAGDSACTGGTVCTDLGCLAPCKADGECAKGLVCKKSLCTPPTVTEAKPLVCASGDDCTKLGAGALCVDGKCVAAPPCEGASCSCKYSSDCGTGRLCVDSKCETACGPGAPACPTGFDCGDKGYCVEGKPTCGPLAGGAACPSGQKCVDGRCSTGCASDDQCLGADGKPDPKQRCIGGACVPDPRTDPTCSGDTQCTSGTQKCVDGFCKYTCASDDACKAIDSRLGSCSETEKICRAPEEIAAKCTSKADCGDKSCVDGQCK